MEPAVWALVVGSLLIFMAISHSMVQRLPLSSAMIYLAVGVAISPVGIGILRPNLNAHAPLLERIAEIALLISLFSAGLKLRQPLADSRWRLALRLAFIGLLASVALTVGAVMLIGLPFGVALLLAAAIAPTDPVLAADVQVDNAVDRDRLRFSLTGESSLNDGIALPLIALALQIITSEFQQPSLPMQLSLLQKLLHWIAVDYVWGIGGGVVIGAVCGLLVGRLVLYLRTQQKEALGLDEFLVLGLIAVAYGLATLAHASPFLAVFFAGLSVGHTTENTRAEIPAYPIEKLSELASTPEHAAPLMMRALRGFNEQLERIAEVAIVILVGALLTDIKIDTAAIVICLYTFCVARPLSVQIALLGARVTGTQRKLMAWFGVRGVGSIYYALFALNHGLPTPWWDTFLSIIFLTCASSIVAHGISVTPLMNYYRRNSRQ